MFPKITARADSSCVSADQSKWMLSASGQTPCQVAESVVRVCTSTAQVQHLSVDVTCSTLGTPNNGSCCCSTVTYALVAGCWVCQTGRAPNLLTTTYATWLAGCGSILYTLPPEVRSANPPIDVPDWAFPRPATLNSTWNITQAQQAVNYTPPPSTTVSTSTSPTTASTPSLSRAAQSSTLPEQAPRSLAAPIAVVCVLALAIVLGMALWLYKRRNRVSPSTRPPPNFSIDDPATPLREPGHDRVGVGGEGSGGLSWWKKTIGKGKNGQDQRGNRSDPGKIDAWHYPFEYTPVSVDSSPGAGYPTGQPAQYLSPNGQGPGHYDPYLVGSMSRVTLHGEESDHEQRRRERQERRERRERRGLGSSETNLLAGRPSGETLRPSTSQGLHAQASHATLRYSPTPGSAPQQYAYNGVPPSYTPSNLQPGTGHSRSAAPSPTPGLFATPYVPPTTPTSHNRPGGHSPIPPSRHSPVPPGSLSPSPLPPSTSSQQHTYPQSPRAHAHTHTFEVQLSPTQYADLMNRYPEIRVRTRRHRRRDRDRDRDRDRASGDEGGVGEGRERRGRPRSWSVPAPPAPEDADAEEEDDTIDDGRPRNGPELTEKYRKRRRRRGTDADSRGKVLEAAGIVRERVVAGADSGRARALDGGVSLMGGPPPRVR